MRRPFSWASLILLTIATATVVPSTPQASAATYAPGVGPGDWVLYGEVSGSWNIPFMDPPSFIKDAMATNWIRTEVLSVVDNDITAAQTWNFDNATGQKTIALTGNVETGSGNLTIAIISKGLTTEDVVPLSSVYVTINRTLPRIYLGVIRQVNVFDYTVSQSTTYGRFYQQALIFWDQITGVLLESSFVENISSLVGTFTGTAHILITETNLWQAPPRPDFTITAQPRSLTFEPGTTGTSSITVTSIDAYSGIVYLTSTVSPMGLSVSPESISIILGAGKTESFQLTISTVSETEPGTYTVTVLGEGGLPSAQSASVTVVVTSPVPLADFALGAISPVTVAAGSSDTLTLTVTQMGGFTGTVTLNATVFPLGPRGSLEPSTISWPSAYSYASSRLTVSVPSSTPPGIYTITITGTSGSKSHTTTITLTVNRSVPPPTTQSSPNTQLILGLPILALAGLALVLAVAVAVVAFLVSRKPEPSPEF